MLTLHRDLHHAHAQVNMPKRQPPTPQTIFLFFGTSFPKIEGAGWGGGAQQQQQKSAAAPAAARQGNEKNTARRSNALLTCRLVVF